MRDMLESDEAHPLAAWSAEFERIHADLDDALRLEAQLAVAARTPEQRQYLEIHSLNFGMRPLARFHSRAAVMLMRLAIKFGRIATAPGIP